MTHSNLNRIFHTLRTHHRKLSHRAIKALAVKTAKEHPWVHRYVNGVDTAPWLG